ncbi:MAG TPA: carboxypeptidase-like regulatory domain-containing protein, partial [Fibrobacteria bacterium]|nr:carboxypeptidase-like regulatory domain-containing protein [Fibrobacteria bacterium]
KVIGPQGRPAAGALVLLRHGSLLAPGAFAQRATFADSAGRFRFAGLPWDAAAFRLTARLLNGGCALAAPVQEAPGPRLSASPPAVIRLAPDLSLRVTFRVPQGRPPAEGVVSFEGDGRWIPFAGSEALLTGLPSERVGVKYHSELYGSGVLFADFRAGRDKDTVIDLVEPQWVVGTLRDAENRPVADALYLVGNAFRGMTSRTGPDGVFRVRRGRPGPLVVHIRHPDFRDTVLSLARGAVSAPLEARLDSGAAPIRGTVRPPVGDPRRCLVEAHPLNVRRAASRSRWPGGEIRRALPDSVGVFALRGLESETYRVRIACPSADLWEDTARPGAMLAEAIPGPARALAGRILSASAADSAPLPAAAVALFGTAPDSPEAALAGAETRADSLGRFVFAPRFAGTAVLCASAPGHAAACRFIASDDTLPVLLSLDTSLRLHVRLLGFPDSAPVVGARVRVRRVGAKGSGWSGETGPEGIFLAEGLSRGDYVVESRDSSRLPFRAAYRVAGDSLLTALLLPSRTLAGTLLDAEGRPARGLRVLARAEWPAGPACPGGIVEAPVAPDGSFTLIGLGDCPAILGVAAARSRAAPFLPLWRRDRVDPASSEPLTVRLPARRTWDITLSS